MGKSKKKIMMVINFCSSIDFPRHGGGDDLLPRNGGGVYLLSKERGRAYLDKLLFFC